MVWGEGEGPESVCDGLMGKKGKKKKKKKKKKMKKGVEVIDDPRGLAV